MNKFKKNDKVILIKGKDKGKKGKILKVFPNQNKVIIEKVNIAKKHIKPQQDKQGGIVDIPKPIHWSNVILLDSDNKAVSRINYKTIKKTKVRINSKTNKPLK